MSAAYEGPVDCLGFLAPVVPSGAFAYRCRFMDASWRRGGDCWMPYGLRRTMDPGLRKGLTPDGEVLVQVLPNGRWVFSLVDKWISASNAETGPRPFPSVLHTEQPDHMVDVTRRLNLLFVTYCGRKDWCILEPVQTWVASQRRFWIF